LNEMTKLVFSRTLKDVTWRNSRLLHELDPREIETMKKQPGKDMIVFGSGSIVLNLLEAKAYPSGDVMLRYARPN